MTGASAVGAQWRQSTFSQLTHYQHEACRSCSRVGGVGGERMPPASAAPAVKGSHQPWLHSPSLWPNIWGMDDKDDLDHLGPPDELINRDERMRSRAWVCSSCRQVVKSATPITVPAPCLRCGGVAFETVRPEPQ
jgi:hypothetical protein